MSVTVYRITTMLSSVLHPVPVGTNLGLFHLLWTLFSGATFYPSAGGASPQTTPAGYYPHALAFPFLGTTGHFEAPGPLAARIYSTRGDARFGITRRKLLPRRLPGSDVRRRVRQGRPFPAAGVHFRAGSVRSRGNGSPGGRSDRRAADWRDDDVRADLELPDRVAPAGGLRGGAWIPPRSTDSPVPKTGR